MLPEAVSIRFCCRQLRPIRSRHAFALQRPRTKTDQSGLPTCHSLADDILGLWQVQPQMESKHTVPFVRVKISKDWVRRSAGASQSVQTRDGFDMAGDRISKILEL